MTTIRYKHLKAIIFLCVLLPVHGKRKPAWRITSTLGDIGVRDVRFGESVAIDGDNIIVGEPGWPGIIFVGEQPLRTGSVSFYKKIFPSKAADSPWVLQNRINTFPGSCCTWRSRIWFSVALDVNATILTVGAPGDQDGDFISTGSVHVYYALSLGSWLPAAKLYADDSLRNDRFGRSVAANKDRIVVGAPGHDYYSTNSGAAYVFNRTDLGAWVQEQKLMPLLASGDVFGNSVTMDHGEKDILVVDADYVDTVGDNAGALFIYEYDSKTFRWIPTERTRRNAGGSEYLGVSVDISNGILVAGAWGVDGKGPNTDKGNVFVLAQQKCPFLLQWRCKRNGF